MRFLKGITVLLLVIGLIAALPISAEQPPLSFDYEPIAQNADWTLFVNSENGDFMLKDRASGREWYSNPPSVENDSVTKGVTQTNLRSMLTVSYVETNTLASSPAELTVNSYIGAILNESVTVEKKENGYSVCYEFLDEGFKIPVEVTLETDGLHVCIPTKKISSKGNNFITKIDLLSGLMSAGVEETDGALFVPSGSGALIYFQSHKGGYGSYSEEVYGQDAAINMTESSACTQGIQIPVYGIIKGDTAMAAVIISGDSAAFICADGIGPTMGYNRVYSRYQLVTLDSTKLFEADYFNQRVIFSAENRKKIEDFEVSFTPLNGEKAGLAGIAETYRSYLRKQGVKEAPKLPALACTLYGAATRKASFLGIPYEKTFAMTTFDEAGEILKELNGSGVNTVLCYEGWTNSGMQNKKIPVSPSPIGVLGGKKGYQRLLKTLKQCDADVFMDVDFRSVRKSGHGFSVLGDTIKTMFGTRSSQYRFMLSTGVPTLNESAWYLIRSKDIPVAAKRFAKKFDDPVGISLNGFGDALYSNFYKKDSLSRLDCLEAYRKTASVFGNTPLAVTSGNAYTYVYADRIFRLPQTHNAHLLFDESVPFLQMVLHGMIPYTSEPINRSTDTGNAILDCIAYGSDPYFIGIAGDSGDLIETNFNSLYSTSYSMWKEEAQKSFAVYSKVHEHLYDQTIIGYRWIQDGVSETVFSNGTKILVNRTDEAVSVNGTVVMGRNYEVIQ